MRILLLGSTGQIGWELNRSLAHLAEVLSPSHDEVDLTDSSTLESIINQFKPHIIVNASAYTNVDNAEKDQSIAFVLNVDVPKLLAAHAKKHDAVLIHYSTDYVFDGSQVGPYLETDTPSPLNVYGKSKLLGERAIEDSGCRYLILRTSWVYSSRRNNFLITIIDLLKNKAEISVISDQVGSPSSAYSISIMTSCVIMQYREKISKRICIDTTGLYHVVNTGNTSWYGFASEIRANLINTGYEENKLALIKPVSTLEYGSSTLRPLNSCLSTEKFQKVFSIKIPSWKKCLSDQIQSLYPQMSSSNNL